MALHAPKRRRLGNTLAGEGNSLSPYDSNPTRPPILQDSLSIPKNAPHLSMSGGSIHPKKSVDARLHQINPVSGSSLFGFQLQELLEKVKATHGSRMKRAEDVLRKLKRIIELIPDREPVTILKAEQSLRESHNIAVPFPEPKPDTEARYMLAYAKPENINTVGSYARKTAVRIRGHEVIDLAVTMPSHIFQEKDYLNYKYFHKRAYYLACLAAGILRNKDCSYRLSFAYQNDNHLQPIILVDPSLDGGEDDFSSSKCQLRIILAAAERLFPIARTLPQKNCIRSKMTQGMATVATPLYNATLRSECSSLLYSDLLDSAFVYSDAFGDACSLGSIWLQQRGLGTDLADGGFGQFEWACIIAILLLRGGVGGRPIFSKGLNSYQLFKATLQYLAATDLTLNPFMIHSNDSELSDYKEPLFFDGEQGLNILFKMTPWSYKTLRHEACITIKSLNEVLGDKFSSALTTRVDELLLRFDYIFSIPMIPSWTPPSGALDSSHRVAKFCQKLHDALSTGLGDRVNLICLQYTKDLPWPITSPKPLKDNNCSRSVLVGLLLNAEQYGRIVDRGPPAEDKNAAAAFRIFWGEKAELRRFKDGSILESLVWSTAGSNGSILDEIVMHVLERHVGIEAAHEINFLGNVFGRLLPDSTKSNPLAVYQPILNAFENFEKEIRSLEGLPLQIRQVSAASPELRYSSIDAPNLGCDTSLIQPAGVYVQFEGSARWPDDLAAIQRTKVAFLLKIGELLEESTNGLIARLGLENERLKLLNQAFIDIIYPAGASFRLRIHHEQELVILERLLRDKFNNLGRGAEVAFALSTHKRNFVQRSLHTQAVRTLSTRFPLLSPSIRIMKKWRDCHLLSSHISDELIELLTIRTFLQPYPWQFPASVTTGFLRTLAFISKWHWQSEPLIVDLGHEMSARDVEGINARFEAWRKVDPGMNRIVLFAASNLDPDGISWTEQRPSKVVAAHFTGLARAACKLAKEQALQIKPSALFSRSTASYDFIIHLNPQLVGGNLGQDHQRSIFKNLDIRAIRNTSLIGFDPVHLYLEELTSLYSNNILFFQDTHGGPCIAGLWNPHTGLRDWKVNTTYSTMPTLLQSGDADTKIAINKTATLHDLARLGGDMVSRIEVKR